MAWAYTRAHPEMDNAEVTVLLALADRLNVKTRVLCPSLARLASDAHVSVKTVQRSLDKLISRGVLIRTSGGKGRVNRYMLTIDPGHSDHSHHDHSQDDHTTLATVTNHLGHHDHAPRSQSPTNQERTKEKEPALSDAASPNGGDAHEPGLRVVVSKSSDHLAAHAAMREITDALRKKWTMPA